MNNIHFGQFLEKRIHSKWKQHLINLNYRVWSEIQAALWRWYRHYKGWKIRCRTSTMTNAKIHIFEGNAAAATFWEDCCKAKQRTTRRTSTLLTCIRPMWTPIFIYASAIGTRHAEVRSLLELGQCCIYDSRWIESAMANRKHHSLGSLTYCSIYHLLIAVQFRGRYVKEHIITVCRRHVHSRPKEMLLCVRTFFCCWTQITYIPLHWTNIELDFIPSWHRNFITSRITVELEVCRSRWKTVFMNCIAHSSWEGAPSHTLAPNVDDCDLWKCRKLSLGFEYGLMASWDRINT